MHSDLEAKFKLFIDQQTKGMEDYMGPIALKYKSQFGNDIMEYFQWLNMAYQLKSRIPHLTEEMLSPEALSKHSRTPKNPQNT